MERSDRLDRPYTSSGSEDDRREDGRRDRIDSRNSSARLSVTQSEYFSESQLAFDRDDKFASVENYPGADREQYDYVAERRNVFTTNVLESTAHLIKGCLGAGILAMPEAYMFGGMWTSLAVSIIVGIIALYNMLMLGTSAQFMYRTLRIPKLTYPDLVEVAIATGPIKCCRKFSKVCRYVLDGVIFVQLCSTCNIYQIMMATTLKEVLEHVSVTVKDADLHLRLYVLFLTVPLILLCCIRKLKYMAPFSIVGDIFLAICVATALCYSVAEAENISARPAWRSVGGLFKFLGVFIYSIDGFCVALPIENNMAQPAFFPTVVWLGMTIVLISVTVVGFLGYWGWGERCESPFTLHMPKEIIPIVLQFMLTLVLAVTFAIHFWVPFRIAWRYMNKKFKRKNGWWERLFRTIHVILITCFSLTVPNINDLMSFMGNVILAFISFVFPPLVESLTIWKDPQRKSKRWKLLLNVFIIAMGLFMVGGGIYSFKNSYEN